MYTMECIKNNQTAYIFIAKVGYINIKILKLFTIVKRCDALLPH